MFLHLLFGWGCARDHYRGKQCQHFNYIALLWLRQFMSKKKKNNNSHNIQHEYLRRDWFFVSLFRDTLNCVFWNENTAMRSSIELWSINATKQTNTKEIKTSKYGNFFFRDAQNTIVFRMKWYHIVSRFTWRLFEGEIGRLLAFRLYHNFFFYFLPKNLLPKISNDAQKKHWVTKSAQKASTAQNHSKRTRCLVAFAKRCNCSFFSFCCVLYFVSDLVDHASRIIVSYSHPSLAVKFQLSFSRVSHSSASTWASFKRKKTKRIHRRICTRTEASVHLLSRCWVERYQCDEEENEDSFSRWRCEPINRCRFDPLRWMHSSRMNGDKAQHKYFRTQRIPKIIEFIVLKAFCVCVCAFFVKPFENCFDSCCQPMVAMINPFRFEYTNYVIVLKLVYLLAHGRNKARLTQCVLSG